MTGVGPITDGQVSAALHAWLRPQPVVEVTDVLVRQWMLDALTAARDHDDSVPHALAAWFAMGGDSIIGGLWTTGELDRMGRAVSVLTEPAA